MALLVAHAVETGGLEALKTEILAELEKSGRRAEARIFGAYVSLYEAPAESFLDTAREFLRAGAGGATSTRNAAESADKALLRVWARAEVEDGPRPAGARLRDPVRGGPGINCPGWPRSGPRSSANSGTALPPGPSW